MSDWANCHLVLHFRRNAREGVELQLGDLKAELKQLSLTQADARRHCDTRPHGTAGRHGGSGQDPPRTRRTAGTGWPGDR